MKRLTVIICCAVITLFSALFNPVYAAASPKYARAVVEKAYFCTDKSETSSIFAVPYTYCIEVLRDEGDWYYARYANDTGIYKSLYGYCQKKHFIPESDTPQVTFLYKTVTVNYTADGNSSSLPVLGEIALEAAYYGAYDAGGVDYSYVYCQGSFGYIKGKHDDYELNIPTTLPNEENKPSGGKSAGLSFATIAFIVIAALSVAVVLIIYFTTRKPRVDG